MSKSKYKLDPNHLPIATPIPLEDMHAIEDKVDWDEYYGRLGTMELIYADYYNGRNIPEQLKDIVTHVWIYYEK